MRFGRREFMAGAAGAAAMTVVSGGLPATAADNPVTRENQKPGDRSWKLRNPAKDDLTQLGAYCLEDSVTAGQTVHLCVLVPTVIEVEATVYRLGYYGGARARPVLDLSRRSVASSPPLTVDGTSGETVGSVSPAFEFTVGADWLSGIYLIRLVSNEGIDCHATFCVRDDRVADVMFSQPILTYAAYTNTPTPIGKSLYDGESGGSVTHRGTQRATEVSLDRPYREAGSGDLFRWDHDLVTWLEREGYDVTYVTNIDVDQQPETLLRSRISVVSGHDEYWTQPMMDAYLAARDAGVHIAYLGANGAYWRVRLEAGNDGRPNRTLVCWKYADGESAAAPNALPTVLFKDTDTPMQSLWGVDFMDFNDFIAGPYAPITPTSEGHWFWAGTDVEDDQPLESAPIMGYEVDRRNFSIDLPANTEYTLLASSPFEGQEFGRNWAHTVLYRHTGGAWVFAAGTTSWAWGLMRNDFKHPAIHRATQNLLKRMLADSSRPAPPTAATIASATSMTELLSASDYTASDGDILRLYRAFFDRDPELGGAKFWLLEARAGRPIQDMAAFFSTSPEFVETYGDRDDAGFLAVLYRNVMDRAPDQDGFLFWLGRLQAGESRARVTLLFADSPEFRQRHPF